MASRELDSLIDWLATAAPGGADETALVGGMVARLEAAGLPVRRMLVGFDRLHPVVDGYSVLWRRGDAAPAVTRYFRDEDDAALEASWRRSPFYHLASSGLDHMRRRLPDPAAEAAFPLLAEIRAEGGTDYAAFLSRFTDAAALGEEDNLYLSVVTDRPDGFEDAEVEALGRIFRVLAIALRAAATAAIARDLLATYVGEAAAARVVAGRIERGQADGVTAALWLADLRGFTAIADALPPDDLIGFLNAYAEVLVGAVQDHGGQVLKFLGDGLLAMFPAEDGDGSAAIAGRGALDAAAAALDRAGALSESRRAAGLPATTLSIGLHLGRVSFGNVGSPDRLDFTVIGPAANETARIEAMSRSLDQAVVASAALAGALDPGDRARLVSLGRYALRGVRRPQELFTLDPEPDRELDPPPPGRAGSSPA